MIIEFIELSGFRGFAHQLRLEFPRGFVVISGRNGVGKSTVCDAVEFGLTGRIEKYRVEKAGSESLADYLWYRGPGDVTSHYVSVGFSNGDDSFIVTRTREGGLQHINESEIVRRLTYPTTAPESPLEQMCRTSILRDELIAALSLELTETERFEQVSNALGAVDASAYAKKVDGALGLSKELALNVERDYEALRGRLEEALAILTRVRDSSLASSDVASAINTLEAHVQDLPRDMGDRLSRARAVLADLRSKTAAGLRLREEAAELAEEMSAIRSIAFEDKERSAREQLEEICRNEDSAKTALIAVEKRLSHEREVDRLASDLSVIIATGRRTGLQGGHCPLCDTALDRAQFERGVAASEARLRMMSSTVLRTEIEVHEARSHLESLQGQRAVIEEHLARIERQRMVVEVQETRILERFADLGYHVESIVDLTGVTKEILAEQKRYTEIERATLALDASRSVNLIEEQEAKVNALRVDLSVAEKRLSRHQRVIKDLKQIEGAVVRTRHEMLDERLAAISPLLEELYQRLNPHVDWRTIEYRLRGDVRRFLSLRVGDGLNPQFIFSSGQRRAAGFAFLLSVFLSRPWCRWKTLILDDPVQHIDDYRALNLIEILSALRRDGDWQVICTAEDAALATLLSRRLRSVPDSLGARFDFDIGPDGTPMVVSREVIPPMPARIITSGHQNLSS